MKLCGQCGIKPTPSKAHKICPECAELNQANRTLAANAAARAARIKKPNPCRCGCGVECVQPKKWAPGCREESKKKIYAVRLQRANELNAERRRMKEAGIEVVIERRQVDAGAMSEGYAQVKQFKPWTPKSKPPPLMTTAEQEAIDKETHARMTNNKVWPVSTHWLMH